MIAAAGAGTFGFIYYLRSLEEVPFTYRKHAIMLVTPAMERTVGEHTFDEVRAVGAVADVSAVHVLLQYVCCLDQHSREQVLSRKLLLRTCSL